MKRIKIGLVVLGLIAVSLLVMSAGSIPTLAGSPVAAVPTITLPTPAPTKPAANPPAGATSPARVATRALVAPTATKVAAPKAAAASKSALLSIALQSGWQIQDLSGASNSISVVYYKQDGTTQATVNDTIGANSSKTYAQPIAALPSGFNGSAVVSSSGQAAAIVNTLSSDLAYEASTTGLSSGGTSFFVPLVMCNNSGFNTFFNVQNAGSAAANISVSYVPGSNGTARTETASIPIGAAKTFDQGTGSSTVNCTTLQDGSGKFIGSAVVTSTNSQNIVGSVFEANTTTFKTLFGYNGFNGGSSTVSLPLIMANNSSFYTAVQVQNVGAASTNVTLTYSANTAGSGTPTVETFSLAAGASKTIIQNGTPPSNGSSNTWATFGKYIGAATVTTSPATALVAIVNEQSTGFSGLGPFGGAYEGFNPSAASAHISVPLVMANNSSFYTSVQVQNAGGSTCSSITGTYGPNTAGSGTPVAESFSLAPGVSKTIIQNGAPPGNGSANNWSTIGRYVGSMSISGSGCSLVAIVNEQSFGGAGDRLMSFDAINF